MPDLRVYVILCLINSTFVGNDKLKKEKLALYGQEMSSHF